MLQYKLYYSDSFNSKKINHFCPALKKNNLVFFNNYFTEKSIFIYSNTIEDLMQAICQHHSMNS